MRFHTYCRNSAFRNTLLGMIATSAVAFGQLNTADATIIPVNYYRLGEGGSAGEDAIGANNMTATGTSTSIASGVVGSTTAQLFSGNAANGVGNAEVTAANFLDSSSGPSIAGSTNWGIEMWVRPDILPDGTNQFEVGLVHLGGTNGGLVVELGNHPTFGDGTVGWTVQATGVGLATHNAATGVSAPVIGTWAHLVYVNNGGTGEFYVDGVLSNSAPNAVPGPGPTSSAPSATIGSMWSDNRRGLNGAIDEVRIFTFEPGEFNINDTFVNGVPEPGSLALLCIGCVSLMGRMGRRRRRA